MFDSTCSDTIDVSGGTCSIIRLLDVSKSTRTMTSGAQSDSGRSHE
jgi:hypothetical protein